MVHACQAYVDAQGMGGVTVELAAAADLEAAAEPVDVIIAVNAVLCYQPESTDFLR
jgi:hypothetical protein